jgi:hypothetical protein
MDDLQTSVIDRVVESLTRTLGALFLGVTPEQASAAQTV